MALIGLKAEFEPLPQGCNMPWKLRLNPYPSAPPMVGVQHGLPGFCNGIAMVGYARPFQLVSMVGTGCRPFSFIFCATWFTFVSDGGGAACHFNGGSMEFGLGFI